MSNKTTCPGCGNHPKLKARLTEALSRAALAEAEVRKLERIIDDIKYALHAFD